VTLAARLNSAAGNDTKDIASTIFTVSDMQTGTSTATLLAHIWRTSDWLTAITQCSTQRLTVRAIVPSIALMWSWILVAPNRALV
ncbi:MAG: hypothetical protein ACI96P_001612, partial [Candidatus Azotimanducaceae bacterium]